MKSRVAASSRKFETFYFSAVSGADGRRKRGGKGGAAPIEPVHVPTSEELYQAALAVADATEPTYCYCNRISFGEMIACDNVECPIEWFHFECVGLTPENRPKGKRKKEFNLY